MTSDDTKTPPYISRALDLLPLLKKKSHFLFGPRQTGKSFLIRHELRDARVYNLLDTAIFLALSRNPGRLAEEIGPRQPGGGGRGPAPPRTADRSAGRR